MYRQNILSPPRMGLLIRTCDRIAMAAVPCLCEHQPLLRLWATALAYLWRALLKRFAQLTHNGRVLIERCGGAKPRTQLLRFWARASRRGQRVIEHLEQVGFDDTCAA
eukprot:SAG11_NODE_353_length_10348_cov_6.938335_9_plen_108_part_00